MSRPRSRVHERGARSLPLRVVRSGANTPFAMSSKALSPAGSPVDGQSIAATNEPRAKFRGRARVVVIVDAADRHRPRHEQRCTAAGDRHFARDLAVPTRRDEHRRRREDAGAHPARMSAPMSRRSSARSRPLTTSPQPRRRHSVRGSSSTSPRTPGTRRRTSCRRTAATRRGGRTSVRRMHRITVVTVSDSVILPAQGSRPLRGFLP